jgi:hypothetical protein
MGDVVSFEPRQARQRAPETRFRIEGALALALDAVDQLVAALDQLDGSETFGEPAPDDSARSASVVWLAERRPDA